MAKSKSFFGLRRGSTKSHTFQIDAYGQQVTKDRVVEVKNPRTGKQMVQRCYMATVSAGYKGLRAIADHSFEGVTYGAKSMAKFTQLNLVKLQREMAEGNANFGFNEYKDRSLLPGAYQISDGSLDAPLLVGTDSPLEDSAAFIIGTDAAHVTLKSSLIASNKSFDKILSDLGARVGDMITFVGIGKVGGVYRLVYVRMKFLVGGSTLLTTSNLSDFIQFESNVPITLPSELSGSLTIKLDAMVSHAFNVVGSVTYIEGAWGLIRSREENGAWKRSKCILDISYYNTGVPNAFNDALATYPIGSDYILNGGE